MFSTIKFIALICFTTLLFACGGKSNNDTSAPPTDDNSQTDNQADNSIIYWYNKQR